ncbi:MAG: aspartate aminotransferase family protein [Aigarchaeota archaeon]|nr:aspartate aminotransferase family protein [Aigarchaeota archaeon]MCX8192564.1 aspartate aminotransferase family protein [Nitrososphaeria archaeon]MDW7985700.1 aspartate aminotransferase family protein [Nitrososphaerota archaeon]
MSKVFEYLEREERTIGKVIGIRFYPIVVDRASGSKVWDVEGREYIDFSSQWAVTNLGHNNLEVIEAVKKQLERLVFSSHTTFPNTVGIELAERLVEITPGDFKKKVWFGLTGSDANEFIYKIMPIYSNRRRLLGFQGSYHGQTMGALSLSGHKALTRFIGFPNTIKAPYPYCYRCPFKQQYPECGLLCLDFIENNVIDNAPPEDLSAVIVEPIQSDGGVVVPPTEFIPNLYKICKDRGISFVVDEVKVGFGRTGRFFAVEHSNIAPDVISMAKPMASGFPLSAVVGRDEIMDSALAAHLFTSSAHPVSCAASLATINIILRDKILEKASRIGEYILKRLNEIHGEHRLIGDIRGRGMILGVELVKDHRSKTPAAFETACLVFRAYELGLLTTYVGTYSNVIEITPPLTIGVEDVEKALEIFEKALDDVEKDRVDKEKVKKFSGW